MMVQSVVLNSQNAFHFLMPGHSQHAISDGALLAALGSDGLPIVQNRGFWVK